MSQNADNPPSSEHPESDLNESEGMIQSGKLAGKSMWSGIWILALPVLLQQMLVASVGLVDKMLGGSLPESIVIPAMDGLSIGSYIGWFISIAMTGLGIGGQALIARAMGANDSATSHQALGTAIVLAFVWGIFVAGALWFIIEPLCHLVKLDPEAIQFAVQYVHAMAWSMPFCSVMMVGSMCLYGAGETTLPSIIAAGSNIINVAASWLLSGVEIRFGESRIPNPSPLDPALWGVKGIAMGTAIAWVFGAAVVLLVLFRGVKDLSLLPSTLKPHREMSWRIVRIGVPTFIEGVSMWLANFFVLRFIGDIASQMGGEADLQQGLQGSHIIAIQWESFSFLPGFAMGTAAGALAGQYLGAGNVRLARKAMLSCTLVAILIMGTLGIIFMVFGETLTRIISDQPSHINTLPQLLFICGATQIFFATTMVVRQGLRGVGDTRWTLIITTISSYGVRLPLAWWLGVHLELGLTGIWIALCGEIMVRAFLFLARFLHGGWARVRV